MGFRYSSLRELLAKYFMISILTLVSLPIVLGYLWLFLASFNAGETMTLIPQAWGVKSWRFLWEKSVKPGYPSIWEATKNSLSLALGITIIEVSLASLAGYISSRWSFKGRRLFLTSSLILHAFPSITLIVATFYILRTLGLLNAIFGVALVKVAFGMPFALWVMKGFYDSVPWDVEMSALVDGATRLQALYKVILPQIKPGIAALSIFSFLSGWGEYIFVVTFILKKAGWTISLYVASILGEGEIFVEYGVLAAVSVFYIIPTLAFFLFTQKYLMQVTVGGVKG